MKIILDKNQDEIFNDLIFEHLDDKNRLVISYGGAGSGKSYTKAQHTIIECLEKKMTYLVVRKYAVTLKDSVIALIKEILNDWGVPYYQNKSDRTISFINGSVILFKGLDDPEKIKSINGVRRIWIEEAPELESADYDQLNLRLRGAIDLQMTMTLNPIDEQHWIKKRFFDHKPKNTTIIHTTYKDNLFIDDEYKNTLEAYKAIDYNYYRVYALGKWGKLDSGAEFYKMFDPVNNIKSVNYDRDKHLHISFDENYNPYLPCTIWQVEGNSVYCIDEITKEPPHNTIEHICTEIKKRYRHHSLKVYIYGDATSKKRDVKTEMGHNFFTLIRKQLITDYDVELRVPVKNPSPLVRGMWINSILSGCEEIKMFINPNCEKTIEDYKYTKEEQDGTKQKKKIKDKKTGVSYEPWGHLSDSGDYFLCYIFKNEYDTYRRGGHTIKRKSLRIKEELKY